MIELQTSPSAATRPCSKVLVCGAGGFIGSRIARCLEQAGFAVVRGVPRSGSSSRVDSLPMDFNRDTAIETWLPRLQGMAAVVNTVGVLRDSAARPMRLVHDRVPAALFDACAIAGVRRVVQISALGAGRGTTLYATSKRSADEHLLRLTDAQRLEGVVLRPSIVFGPGGASSRLFTMLARSPVLPLPRRVADARVQPLLVTELAEAVEALLTRDPRVGVVDLGGPVALTIAEFVASLRRQQGSFPARVVRLPACITSLSIRLADALPFTPWGSDTNALLAEDNVTDADLLAELLGRAPTVPDHFLAQS